MKVSFYTRGSVVQARVTDGANNGLRISTGIKVLPHLKFNKRFIGKGLEVASLNNELDRIKIKITEQYLQKSDLGKIEVTKVNETGHDNMYDLDVLLMMYVQMMKTGELLSSSKKRYSKATINLYHYVAKLIEEFSGFHGYLNLSKCHLDNALSVEDKVVILDNFNNYFTKLENYLTDRGNSISNRSNSLNIAGVMINYWAKKYFFNLPKVPRVQADKRPIVVLPPSFVKSFLNDLGKYNNMNTEMKLMWEISATILITTLRISDVLTLSEKDLTIQKDGVLLNKKNQKTGVLSQMPLPKFLGDIYTINLARYGRIFSMEPSLDAVYYHIKNLFRMYDEAKDIVTVSRLDEKGQQYYESKPLWDWVHPHLLRKTAITTMLYNGVPERYIKFCSGHEARSLAFEDYVGHVEKNFKNQVSNYYDSFLNS